MSKQLVPALRPVKTEETVSVKEVGEREGERVGARGREREREGGKERERQTDRQTDRSKILRRWGPRQLVCTPLIPANSLTAVRS